MIDPAPLRVTPNGRLVSTPESFPLGALPEPVAASFARGAELGILHLAAAQTDTVLPPVLAYFRDFGRAFVVALCQTPDADRALADARIPVDERRSSGPSTPCRR